MANLSDANGTMTFSTPFALKHADLIAKLSNHEGKGRWREYGISSYGDVEVGFPEALPFYGCGRWSFLSSLEDWSCFYDPKYPDLCSEHEKALFEALCKEGETVTYDYEDYEPGCGVIGHGIVMMKFNPDGTTKVVSKEWEDYEDTAENRIECGFEDGCPAKDVDPGYLEEIADMIGTTAKEIIEAAERDPFHKGYVMDYELEDPGSLADSLGL